MKSLYVEVVSDRKRIGYFYAGVYFHENPIDTSDTYLALTWDRYTIYFLDLKTNQIVYETDFGSLLIEKAINRGMEIYA